MSSDAEVVSSKTIQTNRHRQRQNKVLFQKLLTNIKQLETTGINWLFQKSNCRDLKDQKAWGGGVACVCIVSPTYPESTRLRKVEETGIFEKCKRRKRRNGLCAFLLWVLVLFFLPECVIFIRGGGLIEQFVHHPVCEYVPCFLAVTCRCVWKCLGKQPANSCLKVWMGEGTG